MFSQKKSFFKGKIFYVLLLGLLIFGYWINQPPEQMEEANGISTGGKHSTLTEGGVSVPKPYDIMDNIIGGAQYKPEEKEADDGTEVMEPENNQAKGYYLVKEIDGIIKVFYYDGDGKERLIRATDIAFALLSVADQDLFQKGVIKNTVDELDELLQDFES